MGRKWGIVYVCLLMVKEKCITLILSYHYRDSRPTDITEKLKTSM